MRPKNVQANYLGSGTHTITPELLKALNNKGINVLYLPRYTFDRDMCRNEECFLPDEPINGLDVRFCKCSPYRSRHFDEKLLRLECHQAVFAVSRLLCSR